MDALRILAVEVVAGAAIAVAALTAMARQAWREAAAARARHDQLLEALGDAGWWHA